MTAPSEALVLLAADAVLPRRDDLLDDALVGDLLPRLLADAGHRTASGPVTRLRAKYRIGESLRATFRVGAGAGSRLVSARMFPPGRSADQAARARAAAARAGVPVAFVLHDPSLETLFWVYPHDRKLRGLEQLTAPAAELRDVFGAPWAGSELMAYCPEKAATARWTGADGTTLGYAKVHLGGEGAQSIALLRAARRGLPADGVLRLPDGVAYLASHGVACYSPAPGVPLNQIARAEVPAAMEALGTALSVLHRQPTDGFRPFTRLALPHLSRAGELVATARPELGPLVGRLVATLLATRRPDAPVALLHGDLHPKNVLVHDAGVSLVDLDQAGTGPVAAELGGMLARLWRPRSTDQLDAPTAAAAADALLGAYTGRPSHDDLLWYAAAALLVERAVRAVNRIDLVALGELEDVLTTALLWAQQLPEDPR